MYLTSVIMSSITEKRNLPFVKHLFLPREDGGCWFVLPLTRTRNTQMDPGGALSAISLQELAIAFSWLQWAASVLGIGRLQERQGNGCKWGLCGEEGRPLQVFRMCEIASSSNHEIILQLAEEWGEERRGLWNGWDSSTPSEEKKPVSCPS